VSGRGREKEAERERQREREKERDGERDKKLTAEFSHHRTLSPLLVVCNLSDRMSPRSRF